MLLQSCLTFCDPMDHSLPGSSVHGILLARILEWVAISFSHAWEWKVKEKSLSCAPLFATPWTAAYEASPSMGFSRQEYWSGVPLPSPHILVKYCSKFSKPSFSNTWTVNFQMFLLVLEKAEEPEIKLPTSAGSSKKQESSRKTLFLLHWLCQSIWLCGSQ